MLLGCVLYRRSPLPDTLFSSALSLPFTLVPAELSSHQADVSDINITPLAGMELTVASKEAWASRYGCEPAQSTAKFF